MTNLTGTRVCSNCKIEKSRDDFYARNKSKSETYLRSNCKKCHNKGIDERRKNKHHIIIKKNLSKRTRRALESAGTTKSFATVDMLGCSLKFFKDYLESKFEPGMTWDNYGMVEGNTMNGWHIDHILPCKSFNLLDPEEQKKCFHYTNLQPMWGIDNIKKGCKI